MDTIMLFKTTTWIILARICKNNFENVNPQKEAELHIGNSTIWKNVLNSSHIIHIIIINACLLFWLGKIVKMNSNQKSDPSENVSVLDFE